MALRVISRAHNNQVAFGEKRTSTGRQSRPVRSRMTQNGLGWFRISAAHVAGPTGYLSRRRLSG